MGENSNSSTSSAINSGTTPTTITNNNCINMQSTADYLAQLLKDRKQLAAFPNVFLHIERLVDDEINKVRSSLFQINGVEKKPLILPEAEGPVTSRQEKVYVPVEEHPEYNFVGRILGPRGMTAKQLEQETGCKIMVRGRGSMRDKKKEEQNRGKPNWEHLNDKLHVLITVEDTNNRANVKIQRAVEEIKKLLVPVTEGEDELKKRQLMELAIINGTYRDSSQRNSEFVESPTNVLSYFRYNLGPILTGIDADSLHKLAQHTQIPVALTTPIRTQATPLGAPLIISRQFQVPTSAALLNGSGAPPLLAPTDAQLLYAPYDFHSQYTALTSPLLTAEYPTTASGTGVVDSMSTAGVSTAGKEKRQRATTNRYLPYESVSSQARPAS